MKRVELTLALVVGLAASSWTAVPAVDSRGLTGDPESIFEEARLYTAKIRSLVDIPFIGDTKGSFKGAGFIVDVERGWIITNAHIAARSPSRLQVAFQGQEFFPAEKHYVDPYLDVAVLKVPENVLPTNARAPTLECDKTPPVGHPVGAFGHPWSLSYTGTRGIISGTTYRVGVELLQTDAPLNEGNSGGPLISLVTGRVVGINAAFLSKGETEGLNFAVPMKYVCRILELLKSGRDPSPPWLPLLFIDPMLFVDDMDERDQLVVAAVYGQPEDLPLKEGDIVQAVEQISGPLHNQTELIDALRGRLGEVRLRIVRGEDELVVTSTLRPMEKVLSRKGIYMSGVLLAPVGVRDEPELNLGKALMVHYVERGSIGAAQGFTKWRLLKSIDGQKFHDVETLYSYLVEAEREDRKVTIVTKKLTPGRNISSWYKCHIHEIPVEDLRLLGAESD